MTTLMDIVRGCENQLGWQPQQRPGQQAWQTHSLEVHKLRRAIAAGNPVPTRTATIANLALALEFSRRKRLPVKSPLALLHRIPDALALANTEQPASDIDTRITAAVAWEQHHDDEASLRWIYRLMRSSGDGKALTLADWKQAGRG